MKRGLFKNIVRGVALSISLQGLSTYGSEAPPIVVYFGYTTQVHCKGKLYLSSVGDTRILNREAFPKELGCGVLLQPESESGRTDLPLKTSTGDVHRIVEIRKAESPITARQLEVNLEANSISITQKDPKS